MNSHNRSRLSKTHRDELARVSTTWLDRLWDERDSLIYNPSDYSVDEFRDPEHAPANVRHCVRETANYAVGLLLRNDAGDAKRAVRALEQIVRLQFDEPGTIYHGTFYRYPEEPHPGKNPVIWKDYDPNWRQFIGNTFTLILDEFNNHLDSNLIASMESAIRLAVIGEVGRVRPEYTNIALMTATLDVWAGRRFNNPDWIARGEAMADSVYSMFRPNQTFAEYNSPTYYGVNLFALRHWRRSASSKLRELGEIMEAALWRDVARFYHAGLRNLCGPFDRAYGINMRHYAGLIGLWIALETGLGAAPYPRIEEPFEHRHDFCAGPVIAVLSADIPEDVRPHLHAFQSPRRFERAIDDVRTATAFLDVDFAMGAERGNKAVTGQFIAATVHWLTPNATIGTVHLIHEHPVNAVVGDDSLSITAAPVDEPSNCTFGIDCGSGNDPVLNADRLMLAGLTLDIETNMTGATLLKNENGWLLRYSVPAASAWHIHLKRLKP